MSAGLWETRYSAGGSPYQAIKRERMPRIPDSIQECVAYLYPDERSAKAGDKTGGSAFLVMHLELSDPRLHQIYVVTNAHVIENGHHVVRLNTRSGKHDFIETTERDWFCHKDGDDIAVCPLQISNAHFKYQLLTPGLFAGRETVEQFNIGAGDDCFVVGRFVNHEGKQSNTPSLRFGNIAQMPYEPIIQDRRGGPFPQESYLIEARSISGYSGSPVFVHLLPGVPRPDRPLLRPDVWRGPWLLGITWGYLRAEMAPVFLKGRDEHLTDTNYVAATNSGMMGVVPVWKLDELLNDDRLVRLRAARYEEEMRERRKPPTSTLTSAPPAKPEPPTTEGDEQHKERFTALLGAAARKRPPAD